MKQCSKCNILKTLDQFSIKKSSKDNRQDRCKLCANEYKRSYDQTVAGKISLEKRRNSNNYKEYQKNYIRSEEYLEKKKTYSKVNYAIKIGKLKKECCESCGNKNTEAHHDDYNKPLEIRWLCHSCHKNWHQYNKAIPLKKSLKELFKNIFKK